MAKGGHDTNDILNTEIFINIIIRMFIYRRSSPTTIKMAGGLKICGKYFAL